MGFWSGVGSVAKSLGEQAKKMNDDMVKYSEEWQDKSDSFLKDKAKGHNPAQKAAAIKILKSRGYTSLDDI